MANVKMTEDTMQWVNRIFQQQGMVLLDKPKLIRDMPWSRVEQLATNQGSVYLKHMAPLFAIEGKLIVYLSKQVTHHVPQVLAIDEAVGLLLMRDAGKPLRNLLQVQYQTPLSCDALSCYAAIQQACIPHVNSLISRGVPDWRLQYLPSLYENLLSQETMLNADGLTAIELTQLRRLQPMLVELCEQLVSFEIPETIEHGDFHDNNVLIQDKRITINDWGDATISHPFFSGVSWLESAKRTHGFDEQHSDYQQQLSAYLSVWQNFGDIPELTAGFQLAKRIRPIVFAISFSRINACKGIEDYPQYRGYIADALRLFMA